MPVLKLTLEYDGTGFRGWARQPGERHAGETLVRLDPIETDRRRERLDGGHVDGAPGGVRRIRVRIGDHLDDPDDRALLAGVV